MRKHKFLLDLPTWLKLWVYSGHWSRRGRGVGKYCLSRFGDRGSYVEGNVEIKLFEDNCREGPQPHTANWLASVRTPAFRAKMSRIVKATRAAKREAREVSP
jgi:hypothetical protein